MPYIVGPFQLEEISLKTNLKSISRTFHFSVFSLVIAGKACVKIHFFVGESKLSLVLIRLLNKRKVFGMNFFSGLLMKT